LVDVIVKSYHVDFSLDLKALHHTGDESPSKSPRGRAAPALSTSSPCDRQALRPTDSRSHVIRTRLRWRDTGTDIDIGLTGTAGHAYHTRAAAAPTLPGTYPIAPLQHGHESGMLARVPWLEGVPLNTSDLPTGPQDSLDAVGGWASRGASALRPA
jgi:hypothetical protein